MAKFMTAVYSFSGAYTDANQNRAANLAREAFFTDLVANPPSGWVLVSSTIPSPTTSLLAYDVVFSVYDEYRIRLYTDTSTAGTNRNRLQADILTASGGAVHPNSGGGCDILIQSGVYTYTVDVSIMGAITPNTYRMYRINGRVFGQIWLDEKAAWAESWVLFSGFRGSAVVNAGLFATGFAETANVIAPNVYIEKGGQYLTVDAFLRIGNTYYGKLKNSIALCVSTVSPLAEGGDYYVGSQLYTAITYGGVVLVR